MKSLKAPQVPNLRKVGGKAKTGKIFTLPFGEFCIQLFRMNEDRPRSEKFHDGQIAATISREYLKYPEISKRFAASNPAVKYEVSKLRSTYNRGMLNYSEGPPERRYVSFAYNEKGFAVNPRYKIPRILSEEQKEKHRDKFEECRVLWEQDLAQSKTV